MAYNAGVIVCLSVEYRESGGGPYIDPSDARFDVIDPLGVVVLADEPTEIVAVPGRHKGCWQSPSSALPGTWTMRFKGTILGSPVSHDCLFEVVSPTAVLYGPCQPWPLDRSCCAFPDEATETMIANWAAVATDLLWAGSGRIYGPCPVTVRPCLRSCADGLGAGGSRWFPYMDGSGAWRNASTCGCGDDCSCTELCEVSLEGPVADVYQVHIGPTLVTDWRIDRRGGEFLLVRTGGGCWPDCQDMRADTGAPNTFAVTYFKGIPVPRSGVMAQSELTCELVKSCIPSCKDCRIPKNVSAKTKAGTTITFDTSRSWLRALPMVAAFLDQVNPAGLARPMRVASPDRRGARYG